MTRFSIKPSDDVVAHAMSGRTVLASLYDSFSKISECIFWAKCLAEQRHVKLTEIQIVNRTADTCATYSPSGKKIS